jgi:autotransporter-associated beta strand protein
MFLVSVSGFGATVNQVGTFNDWTTTWTSLGGFDVDNGVTDESLEFVGNSSYPGLYYASSSSYVFFRMRMDADQFPATTKNSYILLIDIANYGVTGIDYAFSWDRQSNNNSTHGLEMSVRDVNGPTWGASQVTDIDGLIGQKGTNDINGSSRTTDGYVRTIDEQSTDIFGATTFIDFAVSWNYLATYTALSSNQTWRVQTASIANATDHNAFNADVGGGANISDSISIGWSAPIVLSGEEARQIWTGGSSSNSFWSDANNWGGTGLTNGNEAIFTGSTRLVNTNNLAANSSISSINFSNAAGAFVLNGNAVQLTGNVVDQSTNRQTINLDMAMTATRAFTVSSSNGTLLIGGVISGASFGLTKDGSGRLILTTNNTYTGGTTVSNGILELMGGSLAGGCVSVNSGAQLLITNGTSTIGGVVSNSGIIHVINSTVNYASNVVLNSGSSYTGRSSTNTFNGGLQILSGANYDLDIFSQASGAITNNGLFSILSGAAQTFANGSYFSGDGALLVNKDGRLNLTNGTFAAFGGMGMTNNGLLNVQNTGILNFTNNAAMPHGSGTAQVDHGGILNFTNGLFVFGNTLTNAGTVNVVNSKVTYTAPVVISGGYISDPSTNIFTTNVTVTAGGYLQGGTNDQFVFYQSLTMQSTNRALFNLSSASVLFTNGNGAGATNHLFDLTGSGAVDKGSNWLNHTQLATNFSIGTLAIAASNHLTLTGITGTNALYVGVLDLSAWGITDASSLTNALLDALSLDGINVYYDKYAAENAYLLGLEFDIWGVSNSLLIPIPESSTWVMIGAAALMFLVLKRKGAGA